MLGISFDDREANKAFADKYDFPFPLLCDTDRAVGMAYGACAAPTDEYPRRITYVIGPDGRVEEAIDTKDPGAQAGEILASLG